MRRLLLAAFVLASCCATAEEGPNVRVLIGGTVGLMTDTDTKIEPAARLDVNWDVWRSKWTSQGCSAHVVGDLTALPGDVVDISDVASFRALEMEVGLGCLPFEAVGAQVYVGGGFASRLTTRDKEPLFEAPKYATFGVLFETTKRNAWLQLGMGPDQRLDGKYVLAVHVSGALDLVTAPERTRLEGTSLTLMVSAILGLEHSAYAPSRRDVIRVSVMAGWGK